MGIDVQLAFNEDGDPDSRLLQLAEDCKSLGYSDIGDDIVEGVCSGLSPTARAKIGAARSLYVMDRVLPNGWAVVITYFPGEAIVHSIDDPSTYWTFPEWYPVPHPEEGHHVF